MPNPIPASDLPSDLLHQEIWKITQRSLTGPKILEEFDLKYFGKAGQSYPSISSSAFSPVILLNLRKTEDRGD
ncbi:MAG TPA: hypothetical protein V6C57_06790 [Coleofasciculaceae cyanobacterium]